MKIPSYKSIPSIGKLIAVVCILVVFTLIFFLPYFRNQQAPLALDIPIGMYYPWYNETYGYAVRPTVKNSLISDTVSQFWIWRNRAIEDLKNGEINTWNPYSLSGYEMSPWFHSLTFSPLNLFYFLPGRVDAMSWIVISQMFLSLIGTFLLGYLLFKSVSIGLIFSFGWTLSSFFVGWLTWGTVSFALAMIPVAIYFYELAYLKRSGLFTFASLFSLVFMVLSGHPQTIGYGLLIFVTWSFIAHKDLLKPLTLIILSLLICAPAILPSLPVISDSIRSSDSLENINFGFIPFSKIISLLLSVNLFGNPSTGNYFGGDVNFQEKLVNFGTPLLFLALYSLVKVFRHRYAPKLTRFGIIVLSLGFLMSTKYPVGYLPYLLNLPLLSSSPAGRATILIIFGGVLLGVVGARDILQNKIDRASLAISSAILFSVYLSVFLIIFISLQLINNSSPEMASYLIVLKQNYTTSLRNLIIPFGLLTITIVVTGLTLWKSSLNKIAVLVIMLIVMAEGFMFFKKVTPFVPKNLYFPPTPTTDFLLNSQKTTPDFFRIERKSEELLPPNMWEVYRLSSTSGYDPMTPSNYSNFLIQQNIKKDHSRYVENGHSVDSLDILGVKYFLLLKRNKESHPDKNGTIPADIDQNKWKPVFSDGAVEILENSLFRPPYRLLDQSKGSSIKLLEKTNTLWKFDVFTGTDTDLVLMENHTTSWHAYVDGKEVEISNYMNTFKKIEVPSGQHQITFRHHNPKISQGFIIGLISTALTLLIIKLRLLY